MRFFPMSNSNRGSTLTINGFDMYYEIHGQGAPLLLLHGFTGSGAGLIQGFKQLSENYTLIVPDLRGHGRSTNPSKQFTFRQAGLDISALLDHLNISQCSAIGFSGGGCTLLQVAYREPERIKSMTLVSAAPYFPQQTRDMMQQYSTQEKTDEQWTALRSIHVHGDEQIQLLCEHPREFSNDDMNFTSEKLSKIKTKTLIVQGDRDPLYPLELTIEMYKGMPNAYLWIIPNGGHVPVSADSSQEFINYVEKFM